MKRPCSGAKRPWLPGDDESDSDADARASSHAVGHGADGCVDYDSAAFVAGAPPLQQQPGTHADEAGLPYHNRGRVLAVKLGHVAGRGLGRREDGRLTPIVAVPRRRRAGLGVDEARATRDKRVAAPPALTRGSQAAREASDAAAAASTRREAARENDFRARTSAAHARRELRRAHATAVAALDKLDRAAGMTNEDALLLCADVNDELPDAELRALFLRVCRCGAVCILRLACSRVPARAEPERHARSNGAQEASRRALVLHVLRRPLWRRRAASRLSRRERRGPLTGERPRTPHGTA